MIGELLIKNGTVWDGESFLKQDVLITNGFISKIQNNITDRVEKIFDAKDMIISCGFMDSHTHIKDISPNSIGIDYEKISYPFGVTALIDASAEQGNIQTLSNKNCNISVFCEARIKDNKADFAFAEKILSQYREKVIGLKVYYDTSFVNTWDTAPLKEICEYAAKNNLRVMVHTTNSPVSMLDIVNALNKGDIISHAYHGGENNTSLNGYEALKKAKEKGVFIDSALAAFYHIDYSVFKYSIKHNITPDIISSDLTKDLEVFGGEKYGLPLCISILEALGLDRKSAFKAVTVNPARLLKTSDYKGSLMVGALADIAVFKNENCDLNLKDKFGNEIQLDKQLKCVLTILNGKIVFSR